MNATQDFIMFRQWGAVSTSDRQEDVIRGYWVTRVASISLCPRTGALRGNDRLAYHTVTNYYTIARKRDELQ